jgi:hypothetical protein
MQKLQFKINIDAPVSKVFDMMLGISQKSTYEQWTALFNETSSFEGSWNKGSKIYFIGFDDKGEKGGMVSEIAENILNQFVSIRHFGLIKNGIEITEGPEVEQWANCFENYIFEEIEGNTIVKVELDSVDEYVEYMNVTFPKALLRLKEICEK